jgi:hypothetical protein
MLKLIKRLVLSTRLQKNKELTINLGRVEISDAQIKYDFELLDRYQNFSSEILRLSLIGIGAYAFLLKEANSIFLSIAGASVIKWFSVFSIFLFALAAACSLAHRYYSSDFMAYHIRYLRIKKILKDPPEELSQNDKDNAPAVAIDEKSERDAILQLCEVMIASSALFLGLGTICLAISLLTTLF